MRTNEVLPPGLPSSASLPAHSTSPDIAPPPQEASLPAAAGVSYAAPFSFSSIKSVLSISPPPSKVNGNNTSYPGLQYSHILPELSSPRPSVSPHISSKQQLPQSGLSLSQNIKAVPTLPRKEASAGSCPGDGYCNGEGGKACCSGCPAFNNKMRANAELRLSNIAPESTVSALLSRSSAFIDRKQSVAATPQQVGSGSIGPSTPSVPAEIGGMVCANCGTTTTPLWRRDGVNRVACNACGKLGIFLNSFKSFANLDSFSGLYYKLHGTHRPVNLNKTTIKRRKRVSTSTLPAEGQLYVGLMDQSSPRQSIEPSYSNDAGTSGSACGMPPVDQIGEASGPPAPKKARRSGPSTDDSPSNGQGSRVLHSEYDQSSLPSYRPNDLTLPELAAIAALAMNANHESSIQHSTRLDRELLDHHHHPLHSISEIAGDPSRSCTSPTRDRPAAAGLQPDEAESEMVVLDREGLCGLRAGLMRECSMARETVHRLQSFISRSEDMLAILESKMHTYGNGNASVSISDRVAQHGRPVTQSTRRLNPHGSSENRSTAPPRVSPQFERQDHKRRQLDGLLSSVSASSAQPSEFLKRRKLNSIKLGARGQAGRLLWEICPSHSGGITLVSASSSLPVPASSMTAAQ